MAEINNDEKRIGVSGEQIEEAVGKVPTIEADVKANKQNISALQTASAQHTADIAKNTADIELKANAEEVYTISQTVEAVTETVAEIVANADDDFDTLRELSDWLKNHSGSAAEMNTAIQTNTKAIADNAKAIEANTTDIEQNKSDILKVQRHSATMGMYSQGWYRIAECVIGQGRSAILRLERTYGNNPPEIITLLINVAYNVASAPFFDCNILDKYVQKSLLKKLRIVIPTELSLSSKMYIDIWNDGTSANSLKTTIFGESVLSSSNEPITILNPTIAPELTGEYTTKQFDLTEGDVFDRLKNLKDLLSKLHGAVSYPVTANGSFTAAGATENITNRIRTDIIPVKAGDVIEIINGSLVHGCGIWKGTVNSTNIIRNDSSPKNTNENMIIEYDGNIVITFLHTSQKDLSLDDFDGSVTLYRKTT